MQTTWSNIPSIQINLRENSLFKQKPCTEFSRNMWPYFGNVSLYFSSLKRGLVACPQLTTGLLWSKSFECSNTQSHSALFSSQCPQRVPSVKLPLRWLKGEGNRAAMVCVQPSKPALGCQSEDTLIWDGAV